MGSEFTYIVWYAKQPKGPWIRHNHIRLTDTIIDRLRGVSEGYYQTLAYNEYSVTGLDAETSYSIKVTCHDRYDAWWYSQTSYDSIEGISTASTQPSPDGGNRVGFQMYVNI
jgi:hypothetical protein